MELLKLFRKLGQYFRWFHFENSIMKSSKIEEALHEDVKKCAWIDGMGRRIRLCKQALKEVKKHLEETNIVYVSESSWELRCFLLDTIKQEIAGEGDDVLRSLFIFEDQGEDLPIPIFSSVTPHNSVPFLLHIMLSLGEFDTELDLRMQPTMCDSFVSANLIEAVDLNDPDKMERNVSTLVWMVVQNIFAV